MKGASRLSIDQQGNLLLHTPKGNGEGTTSTGIAVDLRGNAYVTGFTLSTDFPTLNGFQNTLRNTSGIVTTGFVTKFSR